MAAKRRIIDIAMSEEELEELGMIARSHSEAAKGRLTPPMISVCEAQYGCIEEEVPDLSLS